MSKNIDEMIALHNEILDTGVGRSSSLEQQITTSCIDAATSHRPFRPGSLNFRLTKLTIIYAIIFWLLFFANYFLVKSFEKENRSTISPPGIDIFYAAIPGSITSAYGEVSSWEK